MQIQQKLQEREHTKHLIINQAELLKEQQILEQRENIFLNDAQSFLLLRSNGLS